MPPFMCGVGHLLCCQPADEAGCCTIMRDFARGDYDHHPRCNNADDLLHLTTE